MTDHRKGGRATVEPAPVSDHLRAMAAGRAQGPRVDRRSAYLVAHARALAAGRPTASPGQARAGTGKLGTPGPSAAPRPPA